jgi:hypothetical protein
MPAFNEEYMREEDDMRRQAVSDWKERVLRVEEPLIKSQEQKEAEAKAFNKECLEKFIEMAHNNPEWHFRIMAKELEKETFFHLNKIPYEPSYINGLPGYWEYRQQNAEHWILDKRKRLPDE